MCSVVCTDIVLGANHLAILVMAFWHKRLGRRRRRRRFGSSSSLLSVLRQKNVTEFQLHSACIRHFEWSIFGVMSGQVIGHTLRFRR